MTFSVDVCVRYVAGRGQSIGELGTDGKPVLALKAKAKGM